MENQGILLHNCCIEVESSDSNSICVDYVALGKKGRIEEAMESADLDARDNVLRHAVTANRGGNPWNVALSIQQKKRYRVTVEIDADSPGAALQMLATAKKITVEEISYANGGYVTNIMNCGYSGDPLNTDIIKDVPGLRG